MNIGKKIKELRTARNLSQERLAEYFDITSQSVNGKMAQHILILCIPAQMLMRNEEVKYKKYVKDS